MLLLMKNAISHIRKTTNLLSWSIYLLCIACFSSITVAKIIDETNPSRLSERDYAIGAKRAAEAAKRVIPRLEREMRNTGLALGNSVFIRVFKETRELEVWILNKTSKRYQEFKKYRIAGMSGRLGSKTMEGDMQAVEGFYRVRRAALNPQSRFHLSFNLGYPNRYDRQHGRTGHSLMIHGNSVSAGCLAMTDFYIEEIYTLCAAAFSNGQTSVSVHCYPFRMTDANLKRVKDHRWYGFWKNLKKGYDAFEKNGRPPRVKVAAGMYIFS